MSFLSDLIPQNLNEEKEKFFADFSYNPQFKYDTQINLEKLSEHGRTSEKYLKLAEQIVKKAYYGKDDDDLLGMRGALVNQKDVERAIYTFLHMHNLQKKIKIVFSSTFVTRTSITSDAIKVRMPTTYTQEGLLGMLYHEIGTHALRRTNYEKQPWYKKKEKYGFSNYLKTEEGLASLHAIMPRSYKSAHVPALRYLTVKFAQNNSFAKTWQLLGEYIQNPERRWNIVFRHKRGLEDTSKPGGYSKDLVYFEGLVDVYRWLAANDFDITRLYFGKMALDDVQKAFLLNPKFTPLLPTFFSLSKEKYAQKIKAIGESNNL